LSERLLKGYSMIVLKIHYFKHVLNDRKDNLDVKIEINMHY